MASAANIYSWAVGPVSLVDEGIYALKFDL